MDREREVVKLFLSTLSFVLCLIPSLDHKLLLDTNTKWHIQTKVYLSYTFTLLAPTSLLNLSFPSSSKLSFSLRHSSHFCPSLSSCYLVISALSFFLDFSHNLSSISSSWPPFPASSWFMAECCYCAIIFRKCKSVFIESTYIKYAIAVHMFFVKVCVYKEQKNGEKERRTWCYLQWDLVCNLTACWRKEGCKGNISSQSLASLSRGFSEKVKLLCIFWQHRLSVWEFGLIIVVWTMKTNQNISAFSQREHRAIQMTYNNCTVTAAALASSKPDRGLTQNMLFLLYTDCKMDDSRVHWEPRGC